MQKVTICNEALFTQLNGNTSSIGHLFDGSNAESRDKKELRHSLGIILFLPAECADLFDITGISSGAL